jgi:hypothetical protein
MVSEHEVWVITANADKNEGRGQQVDVAFFENKSAAIKTKNDSRFYKEHGVQGQRLPDSDVQYRVLRIYSSVEEYFKNDAEQKKQRALNKLTEEERQLLGLSVVVLNSSTK